MTKKKEKRHLSLSVQIMLGMLAGIILGFVFGEKIAVIEFIGTIFMRLLKMCVYPLVLISIIRAVANVADIARLKKVGIMFIIYVLISSAICSAIGAASSMIFKPGLGMDLSALEAGNTVTEAMGDTNLVDAFVSWVPENPFASMASGDLVQIIFFAVIFGVILSNLRKTSEAGMVLFNVVDALDEIMNRMINGVLHVAPFGVCSLVAVMIGTLGGDLIKGIGVYILAYYVALLAILLIVFPLIIGLGARVSPVRYFKNVIPVILMAATTMSSVGTLPVTMRTCKDRCGVPGDMVDLLAPVGATVNMNGAAASQTTYVFLTMYLYGLDMEPSQLIFTIILGVVMAIGGSGVPGGGVIMCSVMLAIMGMPQTIVPIIAGIFTILDFGCTVLNCLGNTVGMIYIAKRTGELNEDVFYGRMEASVR